MQMTELSKNMLVSSHKLMTVNGNLFMKLTEQQMEVARLYLQGVVQQVQLLSEAKNTQAVAAQKAWLEQLQQKLMNNFQVSTQMMTEINQELVVWVKNFADLTPATQSSNLETVQAATLAVLEEGKQLVESLTVQTEEVVEKFEEITQQSIEATVVAVETTIEPVVNAMEAVVPVVQLDVAVQEVVESESSASAASQAEITVLQAELPVSVTVAETESSVEEVVVPTAKKSPQKRTSGRAAARAAKLEK